ncbi:MAG: prepilin-type N-terminal cleavage/methylation domain-containing protein [Magnetococcales bacterium]|nr:prepilin-type N-terminal cleavage/methylation domain-containing protein [Magnetococcales bacterium]NGZ27376.1 prepilin-type N-terminal cleavage/methylation domain-containing protein [Magnetococcales bacterium]
MAMELSQSKKVLKKRNGFTVIELVIVVVVIGLLAAMVLPRLGNLTSAASTNVSAYQDVATQSLMACISTASAAGKTGQAITDLCGASTTSGAAVVSTALSTK